MPILACGFMVQNIQDNGCLGHYHAWWLSSDQPSGTCGMHPHQIRKDGYMVLFAQNRFISRQQRNATVRLWKLKKCMWMSEQPAARRLENVFGIHIGDPMMPDVTFEYDAEHEICLEKHLTTSRELRMHRRYDETAGKGAGFSCG